MKYHNWIRIIVVTCLALLVGLMRDTFIEPKPIEAAPSLQGGTTTYVEDFSDDNDPSQPGFASSVFVHIPSGPGIGDIVDNEPSFSPPHVYFLYTGPHIIRWNLPANAIITRASIRVSTTYGFGKVIVRHTGGEEEIVLPEFRPDWQLIDSATIPGINLNDITEIELIGGEMLVDDFTLETINPPVDLAVSQQLSSLTPTPPAPGDDLIFDIAIANNGQQDASNVTLTDVLPAGLTFAAGLSSNNCSEANGTVTCNIGTIAAGSQTGLQIGGQLGTDTCDTLTHTVSVAATETETNTTNNTSILEVTTARSNCADLAIGMAATPNPIVPNQPFAHTISVFNRGPELAENVQVVITAASDGNIVSAVVRGGAACTVNNPSSIICQLGTLSAGEQAFVDLVMSPLPEGATVQDRATVFSDTFDPVGLNNSTQHIEIIDQSRYRFDLIGDTDIDVGSFPFDDLFYAQINNRGAVVFQTLEVDSATNLSQNYGVYYGDTHLGSLTWVAHEPLRSTFGQVDINDSNLVAYELGKPTDPASNFYDLNGLFSGQTVSFRTHIRPFTNTGNVSSAGRGSRIANDGSIVFLDWDTVPNTPLNGQATGTRLVHWQNGQERVLVDVTDGPFSSLGAPMLNESGDVLFSARHTDGSTGLYLTNYLAQTTTVQTIVADYQPADIFLSRIPAYTLNDNGTIAYLQHVNGQPKIGTNLSGVAAEPFNALNNSYHTIEQVALNNQGDIVIRAKPTENSGIGIYAGPDPVADKVLAPGDYFAGRPVQSNSIEAIDLNEAGQIAFVIDFTIPNIREIAVRAELRDKDEDGVDGSIEAGAPNAGDGNNDGTPDAEQPHVASLLTSGGQYVTLEASAGTRLLNVQQTPLVSGTLPPGVLLPFGQLSFEVHDVAVGSSTDVTLFIPQPVTDYWKYGRQPGSGAIEGWYLFDFDGRTGAEIFADRLVLHFVDGGRGDGDLTANGVIVDPGGPAVLANTFIHLPLVAR